MEPSSSTFESVSWLRFLIASTTVLGLMALLAFTLRKLSETGGLRFLARAAVRRKNRLALVSSLPLDGRSRLVLTRCDDMEYLVLLGAGGDTLLRASPARPDADQEPNPS